MTWNMQQRLNQFKETALTIRKALKEADERSHAYQRRVGVYFEDESESSNEVEDELANDIGSEDVDVNVFSVRAEDLMDLEEGGESEQEVVDVEVNDGPGASTSHAEHPVEQSRFPNLVLHWTFSMEEMATEMVRLHHWLFQRHCL